MKLYFFNELIGSSAGEDLMLSCYNHWFIFSIEFNFKFSLSFYKKESNADPYHFEIPKFDESEFNFGPEDHEKLAKQSGLRGGRAKKATKEKPASE